MAQTSKNLIKKNTAAVPAVLGTQNKNKVIVNPNGTAVPIRGASSQNKTAQVSRPFALPATENKAVQNVSKMPAQTLPSPATTQVSTPSNEDLLQVMPAPSAYESTPTSTEPVQTSAPEPADPYEVANIMLANLKPSKSDVEYNFDITKDPVYQAYAAAYAREGQRATQDTLGAAAAMTGGIPSSYAISAAAQAGNNYAAQMADIIPEIYDDAKARYDEEYKARVEEAQLKAEQDYAAALKALEESIAAQNSVYRGPVIYQDEQTRAASEEILKELDAAYAALEGQYSAADKELKDTAEALSAENDTARAQLENYAAELDAYRQELDNYAQELSGVNAGTPVTVAPTLPKPVPSYSILTPEMAQRMQIQSRLGYVTPELYNEWVKTYGADQITRNGITQSSPKTAAPLGTPVASYPNALTSEMASRMMQQINRGVVSDELWNQWLVAYGADQLSKMGVHRSGGLLSEMNSLLGRT